MNTVEGFIPTEEQRIAIETEGSAVVRAGAGSGKTSVLAARYIHLLERGAFAAGGRADPLRVEQILAITFTDKAACEMKVRIRSMLEARLARADASSRPLLERAKADLVGAQISTIHSFCAHLLRTHPIETGVDPSAAVLDPSQAAAFLAAIVEKGLRRAVEEGQRFARRLVKSQGLAGAVGIVVDLFERLARANVRSADLPARLAEQRQEASRAAKRLEREIAEFSRAVEGWLARNPDERAAAGLREGWPCWRERLCELSRRPTAEEVRSLAALASLLPGRAKSFEGGPYLRSEGSLPAGSIPELAGFIASLPAAADAVDLLVALSREIERAKRLEAVLTFDDLVTIALDLLRTDQDVLRRCRERYRALLVDEFQDTDPRQGEIIELLGNGEGMSLFLVGDEKQSIYGFRGADVEIMTRFRTAIGKEHLLRTNFRARPSLLAFVNALAAQAMRPPGGSARPYWVCWSPEQDLAPYRSEEACPGPPVTLVSLLGVGGTGAKSRDVRQIEADHLAATILRMCAHDGRRFGDFAILLRAMTDVKIYEDALRRYGIPYNTVKAGRFFDCEEVRDLVNLVSAVEDPTDELALAALLRSPIFGLSDEALYRLARGEGSFAARLWNRSDFSDLGQEWAVAEWAIELLRGLLRMRERATPAEIVEEAVRRTDFEVVLLAQVEGLQRVANVRKFIELARRAEREQHMTLGEFVRYVRRLLASGYPEPEAALFAGYENSVSVMSLHQAKGLEFPVVIVPDLARRVRQQWPRLVVDGTYGIAVVEEVGAGGSPVPNALSERLRDGARDRDEAESARLLYVATTRARDALILGEGKGDAAFLRSTRAARTWLEQVWELIGRERMLAFAEGSAEEVLVTAAGTEIRLVKASAGAAGSSPSEAARRRSGVARLAGETRAALARAVDFKALPARCAMLSAVELERFARCPRRYWLAGSDPQQAQIVESGEGFGWRAGSVGHAVLEFIDPLGGSGDPADAIRASVDANGGRLLDRATRARLEAILEKSVRWIGERYRHCEVLGRELPFVLALEGGEQAVALRGRIDLLLEDRQGIRVVDYKFGGAAAPAEKRYLLQMAAYAAAARCTFPGKPILCEILYLADEPACVALDMVELAGWEGRLAELARSLIGALGLGTPSAFPKAGPDPDTCGAWGCPHVPHCWGLYG